MAQLKIRKLKAFSIIEVIVATVLIMICFEAISTVYINVLSTNDSFRKQQAALILKKIGIKTKQEKTFIDAQFNYDNFSIEKTITKYNNENGLWVLKLKLFDKGNAKMLAEQTELILN